MMTNLFSMFDPSTSTNLSLNWLIIILMLALIPLNYWMIPNNLKMSYNMLMKIMFNEFKMLINKKFNNNFNLLFTSTFIFIMMNNLMSLFPYIFASTSHLSINLSITLPMWISLMMYGWMNKMNHTFTHLVPHGTPNILIPFMVLIESISNIIRPITLTVRLTANMIAGHLLLTLLSNMSANLNIIMIPMLIITQSILLTLESSVSIIQAYVFSILMTLYTKEI